MTFHPGNEEDGSAHSSLSGNVAIDKVNQTSPWLAVVFDTYGHAVTTQAVAGSSAVCPCLYVFVKYLDLNLFQSQCSEDLQHHSPTTNNVTKTVNWKLVHICQKTKCIVFQDTVYNKKSLQGADSHRRQHARLLVAYLQSQSQSQASSLGQRRDKMQWILVISAFCKLRSYVTVNWGRNPEICLRTAVDQVPYYRNHPSVVSATPK